MTKYDYRDAVMAMTEQEAREILEYFVSRQVRAGSSRDRAMSCQLANIGYYAGYFEPEARERVGRLYSCATGPAAVIGSGS